MKIIRVERCSMCPCLNRADDPFDIMCRGLYHAEYRRIKDVDIIPFWCPLEEADDAE